MQLGHVGGKPLPDGGILLFGDQLPVTVLEHFGVDSRRAVLVAVFVHLVDEEQGQHLDAPPHIAQFLVQMGLNRSADLGLFHHVLVNVPDGLAQRHLLGVAELNVLITGGAVDACHSVALVQLPPAGQQEQIVPRFQRHRFPGHGAGFAFHVHLHLGPEALLVEHRQQAHIGLVEAPGHLVGGHGDLLH